MEPSAYILLIIAAFVPAALYMLYVISFDRRQPEPALALVSSTVVGTKKWAKQLKDCYFQRKHEEKRHFPLVIATFLLYLQRISC